MGGSPRMLTRRRCCCGGGAPVSTCLACFGGTTPTTLYLTDLNGTIACTLFGSIWSGSYTLGLTGVASVTPQSGLFGPYCTFTTGSITVTVGYQITCTNGTPPRLSVTRIWKIMYTGSNDNQGAYCTGSGFTSPPWSFVDDSIANNTCCLARANPHTHTTSLSSDTSGCGPLTWSGTLPTPSNSIPDPVGGSVAVTQ